MAEHSKIEWTDATVNFWWGCTKVGPGCDHCYAETFDRRVGGAHWGVGVPRKEITSAHDTMARLNRKSAKLIAAGGRPLRVFVQSMSDLFDNEIPLHWRATAFETIERSTNLSIQVLTKRISNVEKMIPERWVRQWPAHVGLMITVVNQDEANRDVPRLLDLKARFGIPWVGISAEPLLGPVDLTNIQGEWSALDDGWDEGVKAQQILDWVVVGGESGKGARPMHPDWARSLRDQCAAAGTPFFFKQWGAWHPIGQTIADGSINNIVEAQTGWSQDARAWNIGKFRAGRLLDGVEHNDMPEALT